jgi:hypothetical protein
VTTAASARALLTGLVDYAGLFPPAGLGMKDAVAEYARHHGEPEAWMLGRFVVPAARFDELEEATVDPSGSVREDALGTTPGARSLSALVGPAFTTHAAEVVAFNGRHAGRAHVDSVEFRASTRAELDAALDTIPEGLKIFVELPLDDGLDELLPIVKARGAHAKVRTGGVVPEVIPGLGSLARFLEACASAGVPFKATAGLHHAVRAEHPLTYETGAPRRTMHGFLNVFGAAVLAQGGMAATQIETVLRETDPAAFHFDDEGFAWRDRRATTEVITRARHGFAVSFGSCSFVEPVADLKALGVIS